jgi:hypothetical protein
VAADEIRRELEAARGEARRIAAEQQDWREHVNGLFERARAAGLSVDEIVESLGLGAKWTSHRARQVTAHPFWFYGQP